jgi:hypothetical protein
MVLLGRAGMSEGFGACPFGKKACFRQRQRVG